MITIPENNEIMGLPNDRVKALTDGIFAIAMTILVLELRIPEMISTSQELNQSLLALLPEITSYAASFIILGTFWIANTTLFYFIKRTDRLFLWINVIFLMFISLIPFTAYLLGNYHDFQISIIIYGLNLTILGVLFFIKWKYALKHPNFLDTLPDKHFIKLVNKYILFAPFMYLIGIALSFVNPWISILLYVIVPLIYILPNHLDEHLPGGRGHN